MQESKRRESRQKYQKNIGRLHNHSTLGKEMRCYRRDWDRVRTVETFLDPRVAVKRELANNTTFKSGIVNLLHPAWDWM